MAGQKTKPARLISAPSSSSMNSRRRGTNLGSPWAANPVILPSCFIALNPHMCVT